MNKNLKKEDQQSVKDAITNIEAKKEVIANPNLAIAKNLVVKGSASADLVGTFKLTSDPRLEAVLNAYPPQGQIMNREMAQGLNDKGLVTIDADRAAEIEEACINKSTVNDVVGTYLPLALGKSWISEGEKKSKRGSQALFAAMGGNSFVVWTRV